eukprot:Gb_31770 [translate_table: standard]
MDGHVPELSHGHVRVHETHKVFRLYHFLYGLYSVHAPFQITGMLKVVECYRRIVFNVGVI